MDGLPVEYTTQGTQNNKSTDTDWLTVSVISNYMPVQPSLWKCDPYAVWITINQTTFFMYNIQHVHVHLCNFDRIVVWLMFDHFPNRQKKLKIALQLCTSIPLRFKYMSYTSCTSRYFPYPSSSVNPTKPNQTRSFIVTNSCQLYTCKVSDFTM